MARAIISSADEVREDMPTHGARPAWLAGQARLPFEYLSSDEFEVFCYLLLRRELEARPEPDVTLFYYGKTKDGGRDIVRKGPTLKLIQCKHYRANVGVGEIRAELAKLFANVYQNTIETPDEVVFYVTTDLTSDAQDLLRSWNKWDECAEKALTEHLRNAPSAELMSFARTWRPRLSWETGIDLTERARKPYAVSLLDDFFEIRKVIDSRGIEREIRELRELLLAPTLSPKLAQLQDLVAQYEELNPALTFELHATSKETQAIVRAKAGTKNHPIGYLRFPETEAGRSGKDKLRQVVEEGRAVALAAGEFEWLESIQKPPAEVARHKGALLELRIRPMLPDRLIPIRLEAKGKRGTATVGMTYMRLVRAGAQEIELSISGGQFAAEMSMVSRVNGEPSLRVALNLGRVEARFARATLELLATLPDLGVLTVSSLDIEQILLETEARSVPFSIEALEGSISLLSKLVFVGERLSLDLRYPDVPDAEDFHRLELVSDGLQRGEAEDRMSRITDRLALPVAQASEILRNWREGKSVAFSAENYFDWTYQGRPLPLGTTEIVFNDVQPVESFESMERSITSANPASTVDISFTCIHTTHRFANFQSVAGPQSAASREASS